MNLDIDKLVELLTEYSHISLLYQGREEQDSLMSAAYNRGRYNEVELVLNMLRRPMVTSPNNDANFHLNMIREFIEIRTKYMQTNSRIYAVSYRQGVMDVLHYLELLVDKMYWDVSLLPCGFRDILITANRI